jgi:hypothetical protein
VELVFEGEALGESSLCFGGAVGLGFGAVLHVGLVPELYDVAGA